MERDVFEGEDFLTDEESRYLRRQKPVEVRRRTLSKAARRRYGLYLALVLGMVAAGALSYGVYSHFVRSPRYLLATLDQIELEGNQYVSRRQVTEIFATDLGGSVFRVPMEKRRRAIEQIAWVESATLERLAPNRLRVILREREPVAFLRAGGELALVDGSGVVLERPERGEFHFPVLAGIRLQLSAEDRARRVELFQRFLRETEVPVAAAGVQVSETDVSDDQDLRATLTDAEGAVLVHFGGDGFAERMRTYADHIREWRAAAGGSAKVTEVDLRFDRQVIVHSPTNEQEVVKSR
jgi:cell division protein FtsQ